MKEKLEEIIKLVNELGITVGTDDEEIISILEPIVKNHTVIYEMYRIVSALETIEKRKEILRKERRRVILEDQDEKIRKLRGDKPKAEVDQKYIDLAHAWLAKFNEGGMDYMCFAPEI